MNASNSMSCRHARLEIGADPQTASSELTLHLAGCEACSRFRAETLTLDARLRVALEAPLSEFRLRAPRARQFALAASVVLALVVAGALWTLRPAPALAGEVIEHVVHEPDSWDSRELLPAAVLADVLRTAGVHFDSSLPVVYAYACEFRGRRVPHLVVQTSAGPLTVMLLAREAVAAPREFSEQGFRGVLLPAGTGSVAILSRGAAIPGAVSAQVVSGVRW